MLESVVKQIPKSVKSVNFKKKTSVCEKKDLKEFENIVRDEIKNCIAKIQITRKLIENRVESLGGIEKLKENGDNFFFSKISETLESVIKYENYLLKQSKKEHLKPKELFDTVDKIFTANSIILSLKEFYYRMSKEYSEPVE